MWYDSKRLKCKFYSYEILRDLNLFIMKEFPIPETVFGMILQYLLKQSIVKKAYSKLKSWIYSFSFKYNFIVNECMSWLLLKYMLSYVLKITLSIYKNIISSYCIAESKINYLINVCTYNSDVFCTNIWMYKIIWI